MGMGDPEDCYPIILRTHLSNSCVGRHGFRLYCCYLPPV